MPLVKTQPVDNHILLDTTSLSSPAPRAEFTRLSEFNWYSVYIKDDREKDDALDAPRQGMQGEVRTQGRLA
ncbi:hypothetical protein MSSD14B_25880 [Marinobacter salsuginis]|uniref:Uncharacterized protein n=1 Tax=Marinobacter salsuginis TaxID=418719 RepID=A0A5M3Q2M7_9GAMM|nr:hypothetical protein MSSD14B_25880 [Marinobacter salsuginis]